MRNNNIHFSNVSIFFLSSPESVNKSRVSPDGPHGTEVGFGTKPRVCKHPCGREGHSCEQGPPLGRSSSAGPACEAESRVCRVRNTSSRSHCLMVHHTCTQGRGHSARLRPPGKQASQPHPAGTKQRPAPLGSLRRHAHPRSGIPRTEGLSGPRQHWLLPPLPFLSRLSAQHSVLLPASLGLVRHVMPCLPSSHPVTQNL